MRSKSVTYQMRMRLNKIVAAQPDLSKRAKLVFMALIVIHMNDRTGRCNPTRKTLAEELGAGITTIKRGLVELVKAGWLKQKLTRGAPYYSFPFERILEGGPHADPPSQEDGGTVLSGRGASSVQMGGHMVTHGTEKNREGRSLALALQWQGFGFAKRKRGLPEKGGSSNAFI